MSLRNRTWLVALILLGQVGLTQAFTVSDCHSMAGEEPAIHHVAHTDVAVDQSPDTDCHCMTSVHCGQFPVLVETGLQAFIAELHANDLTGPARGTSLAHCRTPERPPPY